MPDLNGKLTPEELKRALDVVNNVWQQGFQCELCGTRNQWLVSEYLVAAPPVVDGSYVLSGGMYFPEIPVYCKKCGNTKYINGFISGVIKYPEKKNG